MLRPTLDAFRDVIVFAYRTTPVNLNAALSLLFALWSIGMMAKHRASLPRTPIAATALSLVALAFGSAAWSVSPIASFIEAAKLFNGFAMLLLAYIFAKKHILEPKTLALTITGSAAIPIAVGIFQAIQGTGLSTFDIHGRIYGTLAHPNVFAFLLLSLIILLTQFPVTKKKYLFALLSVLLLLTYTRAALVGLVVFLIAIGIVRYKKIFAKSVIVIILTLLVLLPIYNLASTRYAFDIERIPIVARIVTRNDEADSILWRQALVRETMPIIWAKPFFGYGFGTFEKVWSDNRGLTHFWDDSAEAHNDYLRMALEIGAVGLALYIACLAQLLVASFQLSQKSPDQYAHLFGWILMFAIVSLSENMLHHTPVIWLTFAWWGASMAKINPPTQNTAQGD